MTATAAVIIIGDEILSGRTKDQNANWIATELNLIGIRLKEIKVIPDDKKTIIETVNNYRKSFSYVFSCGGIGPTHDDITTESIAEAFDIKLEKNKIAMRLLTDHYKLSNINFNEARQKMAIIPVGATLIENPVSVAPGFSIENLYVFAGVPKIMQGMFGSIRQKLVGGKKLFNITITCDLGEGVIAKSLEKIENEFKNIKIGSYPYFNPNGFGTSVVIRSESKNTLDSSVKKILEAISINGGKYKIK